MKKTRCSLNKAILLIVLAILAAILITVVVYNTKSIFDMQEYAYHITVVSKKEVGLDIGTDALYFGNVPQGGFAQRYVNITNSHTEPLKVIIKFSGDHSNWISSSDNNFIVYPGQINQVTITANIPEQAELGEYTGTMSTIFKKT
jgi:hypothetical protein